jgi:phosphoribosyl-AMP cyclohydrolase
VSVILDLPAELQYDEAGLIPVALQDATSLEVLILAHMNRPALQRTLSTGLVHLWSRNRHALWLKGETSGRLMHLAELRPNCELNSLLILVHQDQPGACHTGHESCYYRRLTSDGLIEIAPPLFEPKDVYGDVPLEHMLGAYAWLRDQPNIPNSGTSRLLHGDGPDPLARLREEWSELLGVLDGTHRHTSYAEDALLEAYQVLYWTAVHQVMAGSMDGATASTAMLSGYVEHNDPRAASRRALQTGNRDERVHRLWYALGAACRVAGIAPGTVVQRDLEELRSKPYLAAYFGRRGKNPS